MISNSLASLQRWRPFPFLICNVSIVLLGLLMLAPIYTTIADRDSQISDRRETLVRLRSIIAREAEVQAAARRPQEDQGEFLSGPNEGVIGADLQTRLKTIAERNGAQLRTMQSQPARQGGPLKYIGARLTIYGNLQRVHKTIYDLETAKPYLFITNAALKLAPTIGRGEEEPIVDARLDVFGAMPALKQEP